MQKHNIHYLICAKCTTCRKSDAELNHKPSSAIAKLQRISRQWHIHVHLLTFCEPYCQIFLFADDAKLFRHILRDSDNCFLQLGIDSLKQWSDNWLLKLNILKCKTVSYGRHVDKNYVYHIKENDQITPLDHEDSYKDRSYI